MSRVQVLNENLQHLEKIEKSLTHLPTVLAKIETLKTDLKRTIKHVNCIQETKWYYLNENLFISHQVLNIGREMIKCDPDNKFIPDILAPLETIREDNFGDWYRQFNILDSICFALAFQIGANPTKLKKFADPLFNCMSANTSYSISLADYVRLDRQLDIAVQMVVTKVDFFCSDGYH